MKKEFMIAAFVGTAAIAVGGTATDSQAMAIQPLTSLERGSDIVEVATKGGARMKSSGASTSRRGVVTRPGVTRPGVQIRGRGLRCW